MLDPRNLLRTVELAAEKAGLADVGAHTMRHSAAVAWLEAGVQIKAAADLLGLLHRDHRRLVWTHVR